MTAAARHGGSDGPGIPALRCVDLAKHYPSRRRQPTVMALRGVSFEVPAGSTFGVVGESGCGKSTLARLLVGLEAPTSGAVEIAGRRVDTGPRSDRRALARRIQLVFQDPFSSLDPRMPVARALDEVLRFHHLHDDRRDERVVELLDMVALGGRFARRYPHELSGGQAQRVAIARALAVEPQVLVLDEPTSALDVSVRAEIMNLLVRIQDELRLSYLFISHDLSMVRHVSDDIAVMYLGRVVEVGRYDAVLDAPMHPYTRALADAVPVPDPDAKRTSHEARAVSHGGRADPPPEPASARDVDDEHACAFLPRCPVAERVCGERAPRLAPAAAGHEVSCHVASAAAGLGPADR